MDWTFCLSCLCRSLGNEQNPLVLTTCGHPFCLKCSASLANPECAICPYCNMTCSSVTIKSHADIPERIRIYFENPDDLLKKAREMLDRSIDVLVWRRNLQNLLLQRACTAPPPPTAAHLPFYYQDKHFKEDLQRHAPPAEPSFTTRNRTTNTSPPVHAPHTTVTQDTMSRGYQPPLNTRGRGITGLGAISQTNSTPYPSRTNIIRPTARTTNQPIITTQVKTSITPAKRHYSELSERTLSAFSAALADDSGQSFQSFIQKRQQELDQDIDVMDVSENPSETYNPPNTPERTLSRPASAEPNPGVTSNNRESLQTTPTPDRFTTSDRFALFRPKKLLSQDASTHDTGLEEVTHTSINTMPSTRTEE